MLYQCIIVLGECCGEVDGECIFIAFRLSDLSDRYEVVNTTSYWKFLIRKVSINVLWWLALAMMVSAAFKRLLLVSIMKLVICVGPSSTGMSPCGSACPKIQIGWFVRHCHLLPFIIGQLLLPLQLSSWPCVCCSSIIIGVTTICSSYGKLLVEYRLSWLLIIAFCQTQSLHFDSPWKLNLLYQARQDT